jgi:hypothetical protein
MTEGVMTHQRGEARHSSDISQDGGVQSRSVALGFDVRQSVGIPRRWADAALAGFLQGAPRTGMGVVRRWGHTNFLSLQDVREYNGSPTPTRNFDLADKGTSRAPQGARRAIGALVTTRLDEHRRLLKEIEDVARNEQSMKPSALAGAHQLLHCPEVLRRAGPDATDDQLGQAAHDALKAALATLPTRDQWIGEAILAAAGYEGETVDQRKATLERAHGISENTYKRRRKKILDRIVHYLNRQDQADIPRGQRAFDKHRKALSAVEMVVSDAIELNYACRVYQFTALLNEKIAAGVFGSSSLEPGNEDILLEMLYERHIELILSAGYCFDDEPYSMHTHIRANLPAETIERFVKALTLIFDELPFDSDNRVLICGDCLAPRADLRYMRKAHSQRLELWSLLFRPKLWETNLNPVIAGCGRIASDARLDLSMVVPTTMESRLRQITPILGHYYGVRETATVFSDNNESLSDQFERYLAAEASRGAVLHVVN